MPGRPLRAARVNAGCQQGVAYCQAAQVEQAQGLSVQRNVESSSVSAPAIFKMPSGVTASGVQKSAVTP